MPSFLVAVVVGSALVTAALGLFTSLRARPLGRAEVGSATLTAAAVLIMTVVGIVLLITGSRPAELATAIGYLLGIAVVMPLGLLWALADQNRYSGYVVAVAGFTVAVMTARLVMLWRVPGV